jgi:hypothetical protein
MGLIGTLYSGLDLGKAKDFCALAVTLREPNPVPKPKRPFRYKVVHLQTWELGTSYVDIATDVAKLFARAPLTGSNLVPDVTGVGTAVYDLLRSRSLRARMVPVYTTSGKLANKSDETGYWNVPKVELVTTLQTLMQDDLVLIHPRLALAERVKREFQEFRVQITTSRNQTFGAENSQHDDLVFAIMLACWLGQRDGGGLGGIGMPHPGQGTLAEGAPEGVFADLSTEYPDL